MAEILNVTNEKKYVEICCALLVTNDDNKILK